VTRRKPRKPPDGHCTLQPAGGARRAPRSTPTQTSACAPSRAINHASGIDMMADFAAWCALRAPLRATFRILFLEKRSRLPEHGLRSDESSRARLARNERELRCHGVDAHDRPRRARGRGRTPRLADGRPSECHPRLPSRRRSSSDGEVPNPGLARHSARAQRSSSVRVSLSAAITGTLRIRLVSTANAVIRSLVAPTTTAARPHIPPVVQETHPYIDRQLRRYP
jgi:hypothetical protein